MIRFLLCLALVGCVHDSYRCEHDSDCNVEGGRCELDGRCTAHDTTCVASERRYVHSDDQNECYTGLVTPQNYCTANQPPAPDEGCAHAVCETTPACCTTLWNDQCVMEAQRLCPDVTCDLRIAVTALKGTDPAVLWDVRYDGKKWTQTPRLDRTTLLSWLAPAPGDTEPRLAGFIGLDTLAIERKGVIENMITVDPDDAYHDLQSVDFDRDLRDTIVLDYIGPSNARKAQIIKLAPTVSSREVDISYGTRMAWGAVALDGETDIYPDVAINQNSAYEVRTGGHFAATGYQLMPTGDGGTFAGGGSVRAFGWADFDRDPAHTMDLATFASSIRINDDATKLDAPYVELDCDPVMITSVCNTGEAAFSGAVLPTGEGNLLVVAPIDVAPTTRKLIRVGVEPDGTIHQNPYMLPPPDAPCPNCSIQAVVVRDLDGDHQLDIVLIDSQLNVLVAKSTTSPMLDRFEEIHPMANPTDISYANIRVSVGGAPLSP